MSGLELQSFEYDPEHAGAWAAVREAIGYATPDEWVAEGTRCLVAVRRGEPVARLSYGSRSGFAGAAGETGFVGHYEAVYRDAGVAALREAVDLLRQGGAERIVGPMNGSTWERYRLALPREREMEGGAPFLSEPLNPERYVEDFAAAGWVPLLEYESRIVREPRPVPEAARLARPRPFDQRISIRPLQPDRFEDELRALYDLSMAAFAENPLYSPIGFERFAEMYRGIRPLLDPELVRLARGEDGSLMGYAFAFPDPLTSHGHPRLVLKTLAVAPEARQLGLGRTLVEEVNAIAAARGAAVIHALMHVANASKRISARTDSELFRRYRLLRAGEW
jgi:ribosomal protein S18 acetylase RimI-like enzyme